MDSGFGSLSAFNKCFRKVSGVSPSDFKRDARTRPGLPLGKQNDVDGIDTAVVASGAT